MPRQAQCQCGQLMLHIAADEPDIVLICTCRECQVRSGASFAYGNFFKRAQTAVTGEVKTWTRPTASGHTLTNHFCPNCGTNVFWAPDIRPEHYGVAGGCLTTAPPAPETAIFVSEKHEWLEIPENCKQFRRSVAEG